MEFEGILARVCVAIRCWSVMYPRAFIVFKQKKVLIAEIAL